VSDAPRQRTFPRKCVRCSAREVRPHTVDRVLEVLYAGSLRSISVHTLPVERCSRCGEETVGPEADDAVHAALMQTINRQGT
jgi:hypothetical protein